MVFHIKWVNRGFRSLRVSAPDNSEDEHGSNCADRRTSGRPTGSLRFTCIGEEELTQEEGETGNFNRRWGKKYLTSVSRNPSE
jgi:hypothetical protein